MKLRLPFGYVLELRKVATGGIVEPGQIIDLRGCGIVHEWHLPADTIFTDNPINPETTVTVNMWPLGDSPITQERLDEYMKHQWKMRGWKEGKPE